MQNKYNSSADDARGIEEAREKQEEDLAAKRANAQQEINHLVSDFGEKILTELNNYVDDLHLGSHARMRWLDEQHLHVPTWEAGDCQISAVPVDSYGMRESEVEYNRYIMAKITWSLSRGVELQLSFNPLCEVQIRAEGKDVRNKLRDNLQDAIKHVSNPVVRIILTQLPTICGASSGVEAQASGASKMVNCTLALTTSHYLLYNSATT